MKKYCPCAPKTRLVLDLTAEVSCHEDLRNLSLVSRDVAVLALPRVLRCLAPISVADPQFQQIVEALSTEGGWRHAYNVRSVIIRMEDVCPIALGYPTPEHAVAAIISQLPYLTDVKIIPDIQLNRRIHVIPPRNFNPIAESLASLPRLRSLDMSGSWPGGLSAEVEFLGKTGAGLDAIDMNISAPRDVQVCAIMLSSAVSLASLKLHEAIDIEALSQIIAALPRPERLKELHVSLASSEIPWYQAECFDALVGLEELRVSNEWRSEDYNHTFNDRALDDLDFPWLHAQDDFVPNDRKTFSEFLTAHEFLRTLYVKCGPCPFESLPVPPHFQSVKEAYEQRLLVNVLEMGANPYMLVDRVLDAAEFREHIELLNERMWRPFLNRQIERVVRWADGGRGSLVDDAMKIGRAAPALRTIRWMPFREDTRRWDSSDCGDGDFVVDVVFDRGECPETGSEGVVVSGGVKRCPRMSKGCEGVPGWDPASIPFDVKYAVNWAADDDGVSPPS